MIKELYTFKDSSDSEAEECVLTQRDKKDIIH